jgi:hypothetical protein
MSRNILFLAFISLSSLATVACGGDEETDDSDVVADSDT